MIIFFLVTIFYEHELSKECKSRYKGTIAKLNKLKRLAVTDCAALEMLSFPPFKGTAVVAFTGR